MIAIPSGALITVVRPRIPSRFVQFSLPLQRGQYTWNPEVCPVRVVGPLGEIPAQAERITRHPDGSTALIMVYADAGEGNAPSVVDIYWDPHREDAEDRPWSQDFQYHAAVLEARESFPFHKAKPTMDGPVVVQRRLREFQAGVTFEGVATFFHDCPAVRIEGLFHNALPGAKEQYLSTIGLDTWLPPGWKVQWVVEEPIGNDQGAIGDNQPHFVGQRSIRLITAVIAPADYLGWSVAHPTHGLATTPAEWRRLPAWAPLFIPAADVSFMATKVDHDLLVKFSGIEYALRRGSNYPPYTKPDGTWSYPQAVRHGFFHPCYAQEGGETSGYGITYGAPCDLIETGSPTGFMFAMYMLRMRCDRDRVGAIEPTGDPSTFEQYEADINAKRIRFSVDDPGRFDKSGSIVLDGSFNWSKQIPAPASAERTALLGYEATDWAHRIRTSYWASLLLQLTNSWTARYLIRMDGELARMSWESANRVGWDESSAAQGIGLSRDRILGWQLHAISLAYCAGSSALRTRFKPHLIRAMGIYLQATANGKTLCALQGGKQVSAAPYNNQQAVCVSIQEGLLTAGFWAAFRSASTSNLPEHRVLGSIEYLRQGGNTVWSAAVWPLSTRTPYPARQPGLDSTSPVFVGSDFDSEQTRGLVGLAALSTLFRNGDTQPATDVMKAFFGPSPKTKLRSMGLAVLDSDSVALAAADHLGLP
jgi:hypothetical protein